MTLDLKILLCLALPVSKEFVDWKKALSSRKYENEVLGRLNWPLEGMLFDIQNNVFWDTQWGEKPEIFEQQKEIAEENFRKYPKLIPIYSHRYIPSTPQEAENPVFSVYQMDIIYYGFDLATYFRNEFVPRMTDSVPRPCAKPPPCCAQPLTVRWKMKYKLLDKDKKYSKRYYVLFEYCLFW